MKPSNVVKSKQKVKDYQLSALFWCVYKHQFALAKTLIEKYHADPTLLNTNK